MSRFFVDTEVFGHDCLNYVCVRNTPEEMEKYGAPSCKVLECHENDSHALCRLLNEHSANGEYI